VRFEVLAAFTVMGAFIWHMMPCRLVNSKVLEETAGPVFYPEEGSRGFLWSVITLCHTAFPPHQGHFLSELGCCKWYSD